MIAKLKEELVTLAADILAAKEDKELTTLYHSARNIYEKLAVLKCIDEKLSGVEVNVAKNDIASRFEKIANAVLSGNRAVPESNPHEEDIMTPVMDTIKDMVLEMPSELEWEEVLAESEQQERFVKNLNPMQKAQSRQTSLNEVFQKEFHVDLTDKPDFVKHLFNNAMEDYDRVVSQLKTIDTEERSIAFINTMIKPEYNHWKGKEAYEARFMALIKRRFSS